MFCLQALMEKGFTSVEASNYIDDSDDSLSILNQRYEAILQQDGPRKRAYLKLEWDRQTNLVSIAKNQSYFQTAESNKDDGGKTRQFAVMDYSVLSLTIVKKIIDKNTKIIAEYEPLSHHSHLILGIHFIQYMVDKNCASYSSPVGLHIDDEPLVFVHLLELSPQALGGDNLIAQLEDQEITHVIRLENPLDTILLNNNCFHAVTPLGSREGIARRNIILFTVEPAKTQMIEHMKVDVCEL